MKLTEWVATLCTSKWSDGLDTFHVLLRHRLTVYCLYVSLNVRFTGKSSTC